jgi:ubiquinone biosynthesis protein Coq4
VRIDVTKDESRLALRACKAVALADGELSDQESKWLAALGAALDADQPAEALEVIDHEELASATSDEQTRRRIVQTMILTALMDERASDDEVRMVKRFAAALGVDDPRVDNLRQLAEGHLKRMWIDLARRSFARPVFEQAFKDHGLAGIWRIVGPMVGLAQDPRLARRYIETGELPQGTLGHAYFRFIVDNELGFPGEGVVAESGVWHDLTHVLAGYGTDPKGEVQVVSFIAGYRREDPFFWLFTIALQFHLGIKVSPYSPGLRGHFDPDLVLGAFKRGSALVRDLSVGWDYWPDMRLPLADVRRKYGVI